jgi:hypothetical protein
MDWLELLYDFLKICVLPFLGVLATYAIKYIQAKEKEINNKLDNETAEKYISMVSMTIQDCVAATTQTYVDSLKAQNSFDEEAQKVAFNKTYEAVMAILTDDVKEYLTNIYGDLQSYLTNRIEAEVKAQK